MFSTGIFMWFFLNCPSREGSRKAVLLPLFLGTDNLFIQWYIAQGYNFHFHLKEAKLQGGNLTFFTLRLKVGEVSDMNTSKTLLF